MRGRGKRGDKLSSGSGVPQMMRIGCLQVLIIQCGGGGNKGCRSGGGRWIVRGTDGGVHVGQTIIHIEFPYESSGGSELRLQVGKRDTVNSDYNGSLGTIKCIRFK